jgi:hypothetical protein
MQLASGQEESIRHQVGHLLRDATAVDAEAVARVRRRRQIEHHDPPCPRPHCPRPHCPRPHCRRPRRVPRIATGAMPEPDPGYPAARAIPPPGPARCGLRQRCRCADGRHPFPGNDDCARRRVGVRRPCGPLPRSRPDRPDPPGPAVAPTLRRPRRGHADGRRVGRRLQPQWARRRIDRPGGVRHPAPSPALRPTD